MQSTIGMHSMLILGGSGGMLPQENFRNKYSEMAFGDIFSAC